MTGQYAYSLEGETYRGAYSTRQEAITEAIAAARRMPDVPQTIFVGRIVPGDPKTAGHARAIISRMSARAREEFGDAASGYLAKITAEQTAELDEIIELVLRGWMHRSGLLPTFFKTEAIGEYPVPMDDAQPAEASEGTEVQEIGSGEYSAS